MAPPVAFIASSPLQLTVSAPVPRQPRMTAAPKPSTNAADRHPLRALLHRVQSALAAVEALTRPAMPSSAARYEALPAHVKTPSQMLGRLSPGCEGTKGVFPRCNFACKPCYHSSTANSVRVDGAHTLVQVARQMQLLQRQRGPSAHCQLIGGEVSLLTPEDHAMALETMRFFGRIPMSFTHGDFDYDYLQRLALNQRGRPRFDRLDFAVHFDMGMRGRRGASHVRNEMDLMPFRRRFIHMFERLRRKHGVRYYIAHNMTVQPDNLPFVAEAVREMKSMGFRLLSFQPAALQGAERRRVANLRNIADDHGQIVWEQIEKGMGTRLPYSLFQMGDERCNRMCVCGRVGSRSNRNSEHFFLFFDDQCQADVRVRDLIMSEVGNIVLKPPMLTLKLIRVMLRKPWLLFLAIAWVMRLVNRAGGLWAILRHGVQPLTIVMHRFMDAEDVKIAWKFMQDGVDSGDPRVDETGPRIRETMDRLAACSYGMAQPERDRVVPACVQHSVYDPQENAQLAQDLPIRQPAKSASEVNLDVTR
ncbi:unnamed protein product [Agarophyton chilense]